MRKYRQSTAKQPGDSFWRYYFSGCRDNIISCDSERSRCQVCSIIFDVECGMDAFTSDMEMAFT